MSEKVDLADQLRIVVEDKHLRKIRQRDRNDTVGDLLLEEREADMTFCVADVPVSSTAVRINGLQHLAGVDKGPWKQACDYLLVISNGDRSYAVFVELKKTLSPDREAKAKEQLLRSIPIGEYLRLLCEIESQRRRPILTGYAVIAEKEGARLDKDKTRTTAGIKSRQVNYKDIQIGVLVGTSITIKELFTILSLS